MVRLKPKERKKLILKSALKVAEDKGFYNLTRKLIAIEADVTPTLINTYFGTMINLRRSVMRAAIKNENLQIILDGLVKRDSQALKINSDLRLKAYSLLSINE